jgi:hypothetical protein
MLYFKLKTGTNQDQMSKLQFQGNLATFYVFMESQCKDKTAMLTTFAYFEKHMIYMFELDNGDEYMAIEKKQCK